MGKQGWKTRRPSREPRSLPKVTTGIAGLDDVLEGGFPAGRTVPVRPALVITGPGPRTVIFGNPADTGKVLAALKVVV